MQQPTSNAAARLRLDRRLDAAITIMQASRDRALLARLAAAAGISAEMHPAILLVAIYHYLVQAHE